MTMKIYGDLAPYWPLLSPPSDYAEEAAFYRDTLIAACASRPKTLLELGSGGGNNASFLKHDFTMALVDLSPAMLEVSRKLNRESEHIVGDMRSVRLEREFDCVLIHDAICYMTSEEDLRAAIDTAFVHCRRGGAALFAPDYVAENFREVTDHDGHSHEDGRALHYLEWAYDPDPADSTYVVHYALLVRDRSGSVRAEHDTHIEGLFPRAKWIEWITAAGFTDVRAVPLVQSEPDLTTNEIFVARRPL